MCKFIGLINCDIAKYSAMNFGSSCEDILEQVKYKLSAVAKELYPNFEELLHFNLDATTIKVLIMSSSVLILNMIKAQLYAKKKKHGNHLFSSSEQFWFVKFNITSSKKENLKQEHWIDNLGSRGIVTLMKALEINNDCFTTIMHWCKYNYTSLILHIPQKLLRRL